jgi:hypothetical protein
MLAYHYQNDIMSITIRPKQGVPMILIDKNIKINNVNKVVSEITPSFSGIVNQECKGKLWVDNIDAPRIAIAESFAVGGFAFLGVNENNDDFLNLECFLENELYCYLKNNGSDCFEFSIESEGIRDNILAMFQENSYKQKKNSPSEQM